MKSSKRLLMSLSALITIAPLCAMGPEQVPQQQKSAPSLLQSAARAVVQNKLITDEQLTHEGSFPHTLPAQTYNSLKTAKNELDDEANKAAIYTFLDSFNGDPNFVQQALPVDFVLQAKAFCQNPSTSDQETKNELLSQACERGCLPSVKRLLKYNAQPFESVFPLMRAAQNEHIQVVSCLLEYARNTGITDRFKESVNTALNFMHYSPNKPHYYAIQRMLIEAVGSKVNSWNRSLVDKASWHAILHGDIKTAWQLGFPITKRCAIGASMLGSTITILSCINHKLTTKQVAQVFVSTTAIMGSYFGALAATDNF